jgi:squalene synthase HpnC
MSSVAKMRSMRPCFSAELQRLGPEAHQRSFSTAEAQSYCRRLARDHYENFTVASVFLPRSLIRHFHTVYAYCRWADDLADESGGGARALELLRWWRQELLKCYDGKPRHPVMVALEETIHRFQIPPEPFLDLLIAFEQDQLVKRYQTFDEVLGYCRYSANPVGRLVLYLCKAHDPTRAELADHVCTGLQLANFWQDVARDLDIGRVYLPTEDLQAFVYSDADLQSRRFNPEFARLMRHQVDRARQFFFRGAPLVDLMPSFARLDVELFVQGGLAILRKIERQGYNVWSARPELANWEKARLVAGTLMHRLRRALVA